MRVSTSANRVVAERQSANTQRARSSAPRRCVITPVGSTSATNTASMMARRRRCPPQRGSSRTPRPQTAPNRAGPIVPGGHRSARAPPPGRHTSWWTRTVWPRPQHPRPRAFEQIAQLLYARGGLGDQPLAARPQLAQPRPGLIGALGGIAVQLRHQPRDQHRVLVIAFIPGVVLGLPGPAHQHRVYTHQRHIPLGGKLIQHHPAMPRRLTTHRHTGESVLVRDAAGPVQYRAQIPGLNTHRLAGQHPRVVVTDHHRLLLIGQIDPQDRIVDRHQPAQLGQLGVTALVTTRQTTTLGHDVLLDVIGTRTRQRHQEDVLIYFNDTRHSSLTTGARGKRGQRLRRERTSATTASAAMSTCLPVARFFTPIVPASISRSPATNAIEAPERSAARMAPLSPRSP